MKITNHLLFWTGLVIILLLIIFYFVEVDVDSGTNYVVQTPLLGVIIFHNAFILGLYILISVSLIISGLQFKKQNNMKGGIK